jgi:hypothetical protein
MNPVLSGSNQLGPKSLSYFALAALIGLSLVVPAAGSGAVVGDDYPARKPGLWEMTVDTGNGPPKAAQYCIDSVTDVAMGKMGQATIGDVCSRYETRRDGNAVTSDSICRIGKSQVTTHTVTTFVEDTSSHAVSTSHFDPPMPGGDADGKVTRDGRWVGPCAADMRPGDMIINGRKMHIPTN